MINKLNSISSYNNVPSVKDFNSYVRYVFGIPLLDDKQERSLLERLHIKNDLGAAKELIMSQLRGVIILARKYRNYGIPEEDLVQEGNIGLMKAVKSYDIKQSVRLYTYAILWIKAEMQSYILKNWKIVKIATTNNLKKLFFNLRKIQQEMIQLGLPKHEAENYISNKLDVPLKDVKEMTQYFLSQDTPLLLDGKEEDDENFYYPVQLIEENTPEMILANKNMKGDSSSIIHEALKNLTEKQRYVISKRYLIEEKITHKELSKQLGISSERVRQIENESLSKLKNLLLT